MTTMQDREELRHLIDVLDDNQVPTAVAMLRGLTEQHQPRAGFVGMFHSGKGDLSERAEDILRAEYGRRSA